MKKVGLVTVTYVDNYGSHLQSFALQEAVKKQGYETEIININSVKKEVNSARKKYLLTRLFDCREMKAYWPKLKKSFMLHFNSRFKKQYIERKAKYNAFCENYDFSETVSGFEELSNYCSLNYESVIVGSDQNWRPANIAGGYYTLGFVPDEVNKISYATSFGINHINKSQQELAKWFLNRINYLSVRENAGQQLITNIAKRESLVVCDPTFLLTKEEWEARISDEKLIQGDYIFCYFLGIEDKHRLFVKKLKNRTGLKVVAILNGEQYHKETIAFYDESVNNIGPLDFLNLIKNATYVCTDSFHGCAFSINFEKQFFAFYKFSNENIMSTNNRLDTMLGWAGISNRIMTGNENIDEIQLDSIDYSCVSSKVSEKRTFSEMFLKNALKGEGAE